MDSFTHIEYVMQAIKLCNSVLFRHKKKKENNKKKENLEFMEDYFYFVLMNSQKD